MKASILTLAFLNLLTTQKTLATETKWAEGPFWKAPKTDVFIRQIKSKDLDLKANCKRFKEMVDVYKQDEITTHLISKIDHLRKLPKSNSLDLSFRTIFIVDNLNGNYIEEESVNVENGKLTDYNLPFFQQDKSISGILLQNIQNYRVEYSEKSLMAFSNKLNLSESEIILNPNFSQFKIEALGKDLACDLLFGDAQLKILAPSFVKLPEESVLELSRFYESQVSEHLNEVLKSTNETEVMKAARLGFRLGQSLHKSSSTDGNSTEIKLRKLMGLLFKPNSLTPTSNILKDGDRFSVKLDSGINTNDATLILRNY